MQLLKSFGAFLFLSTLCVLEYWGISSFDLSLKWDMLDCYYPWRFFVGESIQHRIFPLWNPYQHLGYPIYADMRSVFYPEGFLVGLLGGYSLPVLHFLFVFYISMAGLGIYRLSSLFVKNEWVKLITASAYVLCGYFVGHGQEMFGIIAATWIPWVLHYFLRFQRSLAWPDLWKLAFFLFLQLTGGYQALSLILFYLLIFLGIAQLFRGFQQDGKELLIRSVIRNVALGVLVLASLSVLIVTYVQVSPNVERLTGLSLQDAYIGLLTPQALLSLLAPFSVAGDAGFLGTNITMANAYVGVIILVFFLVGCFQRKGTALTILWLFGMFCLLASLGPHTPVREFLYNHVPGMDLFRMSSFFSYFSQLSFLMVAAIGLDRFISKPESSWKAVLWSGFFMAVTLLALVLITFFDTASGVSFGLFTGLSFLRSLPSYYERLFFHAGVQFILIVSFLLALFAIRRKPVLIGPFILVLVMLEMTVSTRLNFHHTVADSTPPRETQAKLNAQPEGFPIPDLNVPINVNRESINELKPLYHNTNIYSKTGSWDGFNSFRLDRFEEYKRDRKEAYLKGLEKPIVYSTSDASSVQIVSYEPDRVLCKIFATEPCSIMLQQTFYPGWEVELDGKPVDLLLFNDMFPMTELEAGNHTVTFHYENDAVKSAFAFSYLIFLLIIAVCIYFLVGSIGFNTRNAQLSATLAFMVLLVGFLFFKWTQTGTMAERRAAGYGQLVKQVDHLLMGRSARLFMQVDNPPVFDSICQFDNKRAITYLNQPICTDYSYLFNILELDTSNVLIYAGSNLPENATIVEIIHGYYAHHYSFQYGKNFVHVFERKGERTVLYESALDFESGNPLWNYSEEMKDTSAKAFAGNHGWSIKSSQMGSPPLIRKMSEMTSEKRVKMVLRMKCLVPEGAVSEARTYIHLERDGTSIWHAAELINPCAHNGAEWIGNILIAEPKFDVLPDDVVKVFVWGSEGGPIYLDDLSFSVYPAN
jgi:hypothetical protein